MLEQAVTKGPHAGRALKAADFGALDENAFWSRGLRVSRGEPPGCLEWQNLIGDRAKPREHYATFQIVVDGKLRTFIVHRVAYALAHGEVPVGLCVCHSCDNKRCFEPTHLFLGTQTDNMRDAGDKNRARHATKAKEKFAALAPDAPFLNTDEAAGMLGISPNSLIVWRSRGEGPKYRKHGNRVLYSRGDLLDWSEARVAG